jgi:hypothetical protein
MRRSAASLMLEADESDKDREFWAKIDLFHLLCSGAMKPAYWTEVFVVTDSPCVQLACCRVARVALILPRSWRFGAELTGNAVV